MAISTLKQISPIIIERELPKMESVETSGNIPEPKVQPLKIMDIISIPDSLSKFLAQMPAAANEIRQFYDFQNLLRRNRQQSLEIQAEKIVTVRPLRKRYDDNCFFSHNIVNLPSWKRLEDSECTRNY